MAIDTSLTKWQVVCRVVAIMVLAELAIMLLLAALSLDEKWAAAVLIDVFLLALISTPAIYFWVIRPFVAAYESALAKVGVIAITDGLTRLFNRREFDRVITQEHGRHARSGGELSLLLLDIDHFKAFNDTYGHPGGDECLCAVAKTIAACVSRPADLAARYGGEEFVCVLPETDLDGAIAIAQRILNEIDALQIPLPGQNTVTHITLSIGLATMCCTTENTADSLVAEADRQLYRAKALGRNRLEYAAPIEGSNALTQFVRLVWKSNYCSGNKLIDRQHQALFHGANHLLDAILSGSPNDLLVKDVTDLIMAAGEHFGDEMRILQSLGYPDINAHKAEHQLLVDKAMAILEDFKNNKCSTGKVFEYLAVDVIARHMLGSDRQYFDLTAQPSAAELT